MTRAPIRTGLVVTALVIALWPAATASASTSQRTSWRLVDHHERACVDDDINPARFAVYLDGAWNHPLTVRTSNLPKRANYGRHPTVIAAGSSNATAPMAYANVVIAPDTPVGTYEARLSVSDGSQSQHVTVELRVKAHCSY
jgi:hypothetical protein